MVRVESHGALATIALGDQDSFKQLFELSPDPTWIIEGNRFVECNEAAIRTLGYSSRDEFLNVHPSKLSPPRQADGEDSYVKSERMMALAKDQSLHRFEWIHTKANGTDFVAEVTLSAIQLTGRQLIYCVWRDITERKRQEEGLRNFRIAMDASADAIYLVDRSSMRFVDVNEAACRMRNVTREKLLELGPAGALSMPREELERTYDSIIAGATDGEPVEMLRRRRDGTHVWVELRRCALHSGESWLIVSAIRDITKHKQTEQALRESTEELRLFADNVPTMTAAWDEHLRCRFANKKYCDFYGFTVDNILGKHVREVVGEEAYREIEGHFARVLQGQSVAFQRIRKLADDESRYLEVKLLPHIGEQGKVLGCFAVTTDITEHKLTEERIQQVAHHDSLTGLPNRLLFNDRLQQAINLARRDTRQFALLYLDLDRFKQVNDKLGHAAGDELLQAVAARIRQQVRESDTVARVGGDEFTVILPDITRREEAEIVAGKIVAAVAAPFHLGRQQLSVEIGTSIGISIYPSDGQDADTLVNAADTAMYGAKQVGGSFRFGAPDF